MMTERRSARRLQAMNAISVEPRVGAKNYNRNTSIFINISNIFIIRTDESSIIEIMTHHTHTRSDVEQEEEDDEDGQRAEDIEQVQDLSGDHLSKHNS